MLGKPYILRPLIIVTLVMAYVISTDMVSLAQDNVSYYKNPLMPYTKGSNYYKIPEGRPRSAFSICCCKKAGESIQNSFYTCQYEEGSCPEETKHYNVALNECPTSLIFTKYTKAQSPQEHQE